PPHPLPTPHSSPYTTLFRSIWVTSVARAEVDAVRREHAVISTRLYTGKTLIHVIADARPGAAFDAAEPTLEDAYFAAIGGHLGIDRKSTRLNSSHQIISYAV